MASVHHQVVLESDEHFGARVPPRAFAAFLSQMDVHLRHAVSMAFRGASRAAGRPPRWLSAASDVRFVDHEGVDTTILHFEAPAFGEAAPELYGQQELWATRPDPSFTGFEVFVDAIRDIRAGNAESERFDPVWLRRFAGFHRAFDGVFSGARVEDVREGGHAFVPLDKPTVETAQRLGADAPPARQVRIVGSLDMVRISTGSFALRLDDGSEIRGLLTRGESLDLFSRLVGTRVAVGGRAVFRPSGRFLRIDAENLLPVESEEAFFSRVPVPLAGGTRPSRWVRPQTATTGINAIFGKWPGDETEEELLAQLEAMK